MTLINERFKSLREKGRGFIPFITAGDPDLDTTRRLVIGLAKAGADVIELGVPFSDPMADGPVIQRASDRALKNNFGLAEILNLVADCRKESDVPIILFSYFNPLLQYGLEKLTADMKSAGVEGVLVTDLIPEEADEFVRLCRANDLCNIFLIAPTSTDERLQLVARHASGFVYAVSRTGVTGVQQSVSSAVAPLVSQMRRYTDLPIAVGFGISTPEQVNEVWEVADAAVVGSAIVREIESSIERDLSQQELIDSVIHLAKSLSAGSDKMAKTSQSD
ncbi:MAG TPA: tryptophan synthase subunit alpha [Blastocatellia bacterium]|nr:tryptophan synthase subunit alpha [Blastocatellia bacterium]